MKAGRVVGRTMTNPHQQRGVVLLIALIILVAMTLAGIGMMRSVDTGGVIAGNLAFKQSTLHASDAGTSAGFNVLVALANSNNTVDKVILDNNNGVACPAGATAALCPGGNANVPGYRSTPLQACEVTRVCPQATAYTWWSDPVNDPIWNNAPTVTVNDPTNGSQIATVSYVIHRMCQQAGASGAPGQLCQTYTQPASGCSKTQLLPCNSTSLFYRITTRSVGARNTVTYTQSLVLISS